MRKFVLSVIMFLTVMVFAEDKKAAELKPIDVPTKTALALRDTQVKILLINSQISQLVQQRDLLQRELDTKVHDSYAELKLKEDEYSLNDQTWKFDPKPRPATAPASEKK